MRASDHETIRPDMIAMLRPGSYTRVFIHPQPTPLGLSFGHF